jgi:pimeloyl-ACP methyl ester carboxylesterase
MNGCRLAARIGYGMLLAMTLVLAAACATAPVGVTRADPREVHRYLTRGVLSSGEVGIPTQNVLIEQDQVEAFEEAPAAALAALHAVAISPAGQPKHLHALAELSFLHAERSRERAHYLAAAVYAWAYLFPRDPSRAPDPFDPRFRGAADLYNRALTSGFAAEREMQVRLAPGAFPLPFGELEVALDEGSLHWVDRRLDSFVPVAELEVRGLATRYRTPGIGAPLAAESVQDRADRPDEGFVSRHTKIPVTAVLHFEEVESQLASGRVQGTLRVYAADTDTRILVGGRSVPLETERTAVLAYGLAESPIWEQELGRFFRSVGVVGPESARLAAAEPYKPGRIPVVLVHGTFSSAGRWAELFNRLWSDARLQARYQFWFFQYDSGVPITYSALLLRQALQETVARLDPAGRDPALREMVLIGHSQGGLLAKLLAVHSGSRLYDATFTKPLTDLEVSETTREIIRQTLFIEPLPQLRRVIFLATPHRGSHLTLYQPVRWIARLVTLPFGVLQAGADVLDRERAALRAGRHQGATSMDSMHPDNPNLQVLADLPVASGIHAHSIIGVMGDGPVESGGDGVVEYRSAHLDGVDSELVVRSNHSVQWHSAAIEEVRRILLLHAGTERR